MSFGTCLFVKGPKEDQLKKIADMSFGTCLFVKGPKVWIRTLLSFE